MRYLLTSEQMKACDRTEIEYYGVPSVVLMERAALAVRDVVMNRYPDASDILVICGSGNNGGDGFAAARLLNMAGRRADVLFVGKHDHMTQETALEAEIFEKHGGRVLPDESGVKGYDLIVDALFGIGLSREVIGRYADLIHAVNRSDTPVLAVDIPSGVSADDGRILGCAVRADITVTMAFAKLGLILYPGAEYCGEVITADIGITAAGLQKDPVLALEGEDLKGLLPPRRKTANKGTYGKLLLIAGAKNMAGAACLAGKAAYRTGCGLVCVYSHEENRIILQTAVPEAICAPWGDDLHKWLLWADAVAIGPGLGQTEESLGLLTQVLEEWAGPLVLDADALNLMASHPQLVPDGNVPAVITPHPGEMARLISARYSDGGSQMSGNTSSPETGIPFAPVTGIASSPVQTAAEYASKTGLVTVLKGARTVIANGEDVYLNLTGNEGMATGGSGDTLTGIIGSLLAQGMDSMNAAIAGVLLHGMAGDAAAHALGSRSMTAADLADYIPKVFKTDMHRE